MKSIPNIMRQLILLSILTTASLFCQAQKVSVMLHSIQDYGPHEEFARKAAAAFERVLNSEEFKTRMLAMKFKKTNGKSNQELYETILRAHEEEGTGGKDGVVDLRVRTLRIYGDESFRKEDCEIGSRAGTIGIDGVGDGVTAICPQRLEMWANGNNIDELAGHYAHEYMHILGFSHGLMLTQRNRERSFVYMIGDLVAELVKEQMQLFK